jgi:hypothetical protein
MNQQVIIEFIPDTSKLFTGVQDINKQITSTGRASQDAAKVFSETNADTVAKMGITTNSVKGLSDAFKQMGATVPIGALNETATAIKSTTEKLGSLRGETNKLVDAMAKLRLEGKEGTHEYAEMEKAVAKMKRATMETRGAVGSLAREFGGLAAASEAVHGLNASMEFGVGISSLFGDENGKVEEKIQSLLAVMMLANSAQEFSNLLKADSILRLKLEAEWEAIVTKAKWLEVEATAAEQAATAGWIGLAVAGVAAVAYGIYELITAEKKHEEEQRRIKENIEDTNIALESQKKIYEELGLATTELDKALEQNKGKELANERAELARERSRGLWNNLKQNFIAEMLAMGVYDLRSEKEKEEDKKSEQQEQEHQNRLKLLDTKAADEEAALSREQFERIIKNTKNGFNRELALYQWSRAQEKIELVKKGGDLAQQKQFDIQTNKEAAEMIRKETLKNEEATIVARLALVKKGGDDERKLQIQLAANKALGVTTDPNASVEEKKKASAELIQATREINTKYYGEVNKQIQDAQKKQLELDIQAIDNKRALEIKGSAEDLELLRQANEKKLELANVGHQMTADEERQFHENQDLETERFLAEMQLKNSQANQKALEDLTTNRLEQLKIQREFHKSQKTVDKAYEEEQAKNPSASPAQIYAAISAQYAKEKNLMKQGAEEAIKFAKETSDKIFELENANRNKNYDAQIRTLQRAQAFELDNKNLTAAQRAAIDEKYRKKEAAIKLAQWKADQQSKEEQAIINTALAVTNAFATTPFPGSIIAAAGAAAVGAVQVATIAAQKPPQFYATGTEFVQGPGTATSDSVPAMLSRGERVVPADINEKLKGIPNEMLPQLAVMPSVSEGMIRQLIPNNQPVIDYKLMAKEIGKEISSKPQLLVNIDKNGYKAHVLDAGNRREILNNRYKVG